MLEVTGLSKSFAGPQGPAKVVDDVSFVVQEGQCYALLGPSGCGKTTTLRCVAGLEQADVGAVRIGGTLVSDAAARVFVPVHERPIGMVFQSYAIWPHMDVFDNVAYPLTVQKLRPDKAEVRDRTMQVLALVGMDGMAERPATRLSGGQQQRVALARAVVRQPKLLLLDEPLSNLDARLREAMRQELSEMIARIRVTALYVTHDQAEAFALAHRIAVMYQGRIMQEGEPRAVYARPRTAFAATFLGSANIVSGRIESREANGTVVIALDGAEHRLTLQAAGEPGDAVDVIIRPENLVVSTMKLDGTNNVLAGRIARAVFLGGVIEYHLDIGGTQLLRATGPPVSALDVDMSVWVNIDPHHSVVLTR